MLDEISKLFVVFDLQTNICIHGNFSCTNIQKKTAILENYEAPRYVKQLESFLVPLASTVILFKDSLIKKTPSSVGLRSVKQNLKQLRRLRLTNQIAYTVTLHVETVSSPCGQ